MANNKSGGGSTILIIILIILLVAGIGSCGGDNDDEYKKMLESGQEKYYNGEPMTREEYDAVNSFNEWKDKQGSKTYDEWDD